MFGLDPFSVPVALTEIVLLLCLAAFVGWLLGRLVLSGRIRALRMEVADKEAELADCRRKKNALGLVKPKRHDAGVSAALQPEMPTAHVPADPLLPAFSHNYSPDPIAAAETPIAPPPAEPVRPPVAANAPTAGPMTANSEAAVLSRIAARAHEIDFDRIGRATPAEADDLKDIVGVGPFLERKLHRLGIYSFQQIARFTPEDVEKVNGIVEFFPGRIERDNWVEQASALQEKKQG